MSTIVTRAGKGSPLTHTEVDNNFTNLNTDKLQSGDTVASLVITSADINGGTIDGATIGASSASTGAFTTATASTSFGSPVFKATNSAGGALQNSGGTPCLQWGGGGGSNLTLDVNTNVTGAIALNGGTTIGDASGDSFTINSSEVSIPNGLNFDSNTLVIDATNNRVGLGTSSPVSTLDVRGVLEAGNGTIRTAISSATQGIVGTFSNHDLSLYTNTTEAVRITTGGNVGIGTTTPASTGGTAAVVHHSSTPRIRLTNTTTGQASSDGAELSVDGSNFYIENREAANIILYNNGAERMRIDSSGNVGIGTSSPAVKLDAYNTSTASTVLRARNDSVSVYLDANNGYSYLNTFSNHPMLFGTNNAEGMRITSGGVVCMGTTTPQSGFAGGGASRLTLATGGNSWGVGPTVDFGNFYVLNNSNVGVALNSGNTSWGAASDERVKDIIEPISNAIEKVSTLRTVIGKYKTDEDGIRRPFLIAQDVQAVFPEAVDKEKDEIETLFLRYSDTIPLLVAAIKEQQTIITDLKSRIEELESK
jgi:hypothetical protein